LFLKEHDDENLNNSILDSKGKEKREKKKSKRKFWKRKRGRK